MAGGEMGRTVAGIPHSAKYTAATWRWGELPYADLLQPAGAPSLFRLVNGYMAFYRTLNPRKHSLRHMLLHRHAIIDRLLQESDCRQVIELAAGFSPRGARVSEQAGIDYYEGDLPNVVALKKWMLGLSAKGSEVLQRNNFHQQICDVTKMQLAESFPCRPSFLITEGLMMYFERTEQIRIWREFAEFIKRCGGAYVFDYIPLDVEPARSAWGQGLHNLKVKLFGGDDFSYDKRTRFQVADDLYTAGFNKVEIYDSSELAQAWQLPRARTQTRVLVYRCE